MLNWSDLRGDECYLSTGEQPSSPLISPPDISDQRGGCFSPKLETILVRDTDVPRKGGISLKENREQPLCEQANDKADAVPCIRLMRKKTIHLSVRDGVAKGLIQRS